MSGQAEEIRGQKSEVRPCACKSGETHLTIYANADGHFYLMRGKGIRAITATEATDLLMIVDRALRMAGVTFEMEIPV